MFLCAPSGEEFRRLRGSVCGLREQRLWLAQGPKLAVPNLLNSIGGLGRIPLVRQRAFCQQALQFGFGFGAHTVGESIRALPVLGPERGQARLQVGLIFFQSAQQPLSSGDFFFQWDHCSISLGTGDAASRISTVPQQWPSASYKLDAGCVGVFLERVNRRVAPSHASTALQPVREAPRSFAVARAFRFASGRSAIFQADTARSAVLRRSGCRPDRFRRPRRLGPSVRAKC